MTPDDTDAVIDFMADAWGVEDRRPQELRVNHLIATDPGGAWAAVEDDVVVGGALALVREDLWALSLLIVRPDRQSAGLGGELMRAATAHGAATGSGLILSSDDPRALRSYWRAGHELRPAYDSAGTVRNPPRAAAGVRDGRWPEDRDLVDAASRFARGAAHGSDIDIQLEQGRRLLVHDGGGFLLADAGRVRLVAASDDRVARELLETALAGTETAAVDFLDAQQQWAIDCVLEAGLELKPSGGLCVRGRPGPLRPYIPSGAYL